jgi:5'-nucleotidase
MKKIVIVFAALLMAFNMSAQKLVILHSNDTHSHIDPVRGSDNDGLGGVIERAAYIDSVRAAEGKKNVLLVDA